jgi:hypothetical protein
MRIGFTLPVHGAVLPSATGLMCCVAMEKVRVLTSMLISRTAG